MLTLGSRIEVPNSVNSIQPIQRMQKLSHIPEVEETNGASKRIKAGDKEIIINPLSENVQKIDSTFERSETKRVKNGPDQSKGEIRKSRFKRGKVVRLSDLPPLSDSEFEEFLTEGISKIPSQIKIRQK